MTVNLQAAVIVMSGLTITSEEIFPPKNLWEEEFPLFMNFALLGGKKFPLITTVKRIRRKIFYNIHNPPILIVVAIVIRGKLCKFVHHEP